MYHYPYFFFINLKLKSYISWVVIPLTYVKGITFSTPKEKFSLLNLADLKLGKDVETSPSFHLQDPKLPLINLE